MTTKRGRTKPVSPTLVRLKELREIEYKRAVPLRGGKDKRSNNMSLVGF